MTKPFEFKPEDFDGLVQFINGEFLKWTKSNAYMLSLSDNVYSAIADVANAKLRQWIAEAPTVYRIYGTAAWAEHPRDWESGKLTHQAKLVAIEEIGGK
jgi:hypothetical protein